MAGLRSGQYAHKIVIRMAAGFVSDFPNKIYIFISFVRSSLRYNSLIYTQGNIFNVTQDHFFSINATQVHVISHYRVIFFTDPTVGKSTS